MKSGSLVPAGLKTRVKDLAEALFKQLHKDIKKLRDDLAGAQRLREKVDR